MASSPSFTIRNSRTSPALFRNAANRRVVHKFLGESPEVYWNKGRSQSVIDRQILGAWVCFGIFALPLPPEGSEDESEETSSLVGFTRVISDGERFAYLGDVFVLPEYRAQGLGKALIVEALKNSADPASDDACSRDSMQWKWLLFARGGVVNIYASLGFVQSGVSYELAPGALTAT